MGRRLIGAFIERVARISVIVTAAAIVLSTAATVVLFPVTAGLSLWAGNWRERFRGWLHNPVVLPLLLWALLFGVGALYSTAPTADIWLAIRKSWRMTLAAAWLPLFAHPQWRQRAILSYVFAAVALLGCSFLHGWGWLPYTTKGLVEVFKSSIEFNFLMAFASYLCLIQATSEKKGRWLWLGLFVLLVHTILFRSVGRSGYVVFASLMVLLGVQKFRWRGLMVALLGIGIMGGLAFICSTTFQSRVRLALTEAQNYAPEDITSVGLRITFVRNSWKLVQAHPWRGFGTGGFPQAYAEIKPTPVPLIRNPHNEYLNVAVQFGGIGLLVLLLLFGVPLWYSRQLPEREKFVVQGAILGIMVGSLANSWLWDVTEGSFYTYFVVWAFAAFPGYSQRTAQSAIQLVNSNCSKLE